MTKDVFSHMLLTYRRCVLDFVSQFNCVLGGIIVSTVKSSLIVFLCCVSLGIQACDTASNNQQQKLVALKDSLETFPDLDPVVRVRLEQSALAIADTLGRTDNPPEILPETRSMLTTYLAIDSLRVACKSAKSRMVDRIERIADAPSQDALPERLKEDTLEAAIKSLQMEPSAEEDSDLKLMELTRVRIDSFGREHPNRPIATRYAALADSLESLQLAFERFLLRNAHEAIQLFSHDASEMAGHQQWTWKQIQEVDVQVYGVDRSLEGTRYEKVFQIVKDKYAALLRKEGALAKHCLGVCKPQHPKLESADEILREHYVCSHSLAELGLSAPRGSYESFDHEVSRKISAIGDLRGRWSLATEGW